MCYEVQGVTFGAHPVHGSLILFESSVELESGKPRSTGGHLINRAASLECCEKPSKRDSFYPIP